MCRLKDNFLELAFSCHLVRSRGWALLLNLPVRIFPAEPSRESPFPLLQRIFLPFFLRMLRTHSRDLGLVLCEKHNVDCPVCASHRHPLCACIRGLGVGTPVQARCTSWSLLALRMLAESPCSGSKSSSHPWNLTNLGKPASGPVVWEEFSQSGRGKCSLQDRRAVKIRKPERKGQAKQIKRLERRRIKSRDRHYSSWLKGFQFLSTLPQNSLQLPRGMSPTGSCVWILSPLLIEPFRVCKTFQDMWPSWKI